MQFTQSGPDVPDSLLQAHEEGRVIFFCGAGISYPAGLPGFKDLVDNIYQEVGADLSSIEKIAYDSGQYDTTLDLLERRLPGQRAAVRTALARTLKPKLSKKALSTHNALLKLARNRNGEVRLVTTNFDRIFQHLIVKTKSKINAYQAPLLPVPKNNRWNGVVYLHGLLPTESEESELNKLVLTSGDFGRAYLTERWAARFVSELFRNYTVCFIGYSINDPVLRYMMDALAADRMSGETTFPAYALGDYIPGEEKKSAEKWEAKGVIPILYKVLTNNKKDHSILHRTLNTWAETYHDGIQGKERIVVNYAMTHPSACTQQDNFIGRMMWALSHKTGLPAKRFAELDPVPSIDWLEAFSKDCYCHDDLTRFGISPLAGSDNELAFSLMRRPAMYTHTPLMALVSGGSNISQWDDVMTHLARWLTRHLNDPGLILWLAKYGGKLHDQFIQLIEKKIDELVKLERSKDTAKLDLIASNAPNAIPQPLIRKLWGLMIAGRVKAHWRNYDLYRWRERFERDGLTAISRLELRELLAPKVVLRKSFDRSETETGSTEIKTIEQLVDWEIVLTADHVCSLYNDLKESKAWTAALPDMVEDFQQLLRDALILRRELGEADEKHDLSHYDLPSISPHAQNRSLHDWAVLIELLRDAWIAVYQADPRQAKYMIQSWLAQPYSVFKRLAFFAATHEDISPDGEWVNWLLANESWWLWSLEAERETVRLLVKQGRNLPDASREQLETAILTGPPRTMFNDNIEVESWQRIVDRAVWLRLAKLSSIGCQLGDDANVRLIELSKQYPKWEIADNEQDEFPFWISGAGDPDYEDQEVIDIAPRKRHDLVIWLKRKRRKRADKFFYKDNWSEICRERFFASACALCDLAHTGHWPIERWRVALQEWSDERLVCRSWRYIAPLLTSIPNEELRELAHSVASWVEASAKILNQHEDIFLGLCKRILELKYQDSLDKDRATRQAINHPIGYITQALLHCWFRRKPNDNEGLPGDLKPIFSSLCNTNIKLYRHARVLLAAHLIALFRVDKEWTSKFLLPLFNWRSHVLEAPAVWEGFLWSPRLYRPLLFEFKAEFLDTASHYPELGEEYGRQYATFLTYLALDPADTFTLVELRKAFSDLPEDGLQESAQALVNALNGAGEQREQFWTNRIKPFWQKYWPKSQALISATIAEPLANLVIAAQGKFPEALSTVQHWLKPLEHPHYIVHPLQQSGLCTRFPKEALIFLGATMSYNFTPPEELNQCLEDIKQAWPEAQEDGRYQEMAIYLRK